VDGQENPLPTIQSNKFYEVQKYLVLTGHIMTPRLIVVNEKTWSGIADKDKAALKAALDNYSAWQDNEIVTQESGLADTFKKGGMEVITPDLESFRKPVLASVPKKFEEKWGKGLWDRIAST
jgi:TRAP-type C4-dicarboxylate transport system substrate-binding protein